jgi:hypothetical protein
MPLQGQTQAPNYEYWYEYKISFPFAIQDLNSQNVQMSFNSTTNYYFSIIVFCLVGVKPSVIFPWMWLGASLSNQNTVLQFPRFLVSKINSLSPC